MLRHQFPKYLIFVSPKKALAVSISCFIGDLLAVKNSMRPPGAYFILETAERSFFTKSNRKDVYKSSSVLLPHILQVQHTIR